MVRLSRTARLISSWHCQFALLAASATGRPGKKRWVEKREKKQEYTSYILSNKLTNFKAALVQDCDQPNELLTQVKWRANSIAKSKETPPRPNHFFLHQTVLEPPSPLLAPTGALIVIVVYYMSIKVRSHFLKFRAFLPIYLVLFCILNADW